MGVVEFARNVTNSEQIVPHLMDAARAELGPFASEKELDYRAGKLLLHSLLAVGVDPRTEQRKRALLWALLRGDSLSPSETMEAVDYILSQMIVQPKGALAECLAIPACTGHLQELSQTGRLPPATRFLRSAWSRRLLETDPGGPPVLREWREAADGLFCADVTSDLGPVVSLSGDQPLPGDLLLFGIAGVKCYSGISRSKLRRQLDRHIARLTGGLQFRDPSGRAVEQQYLPESLWYAASSEDELLAVRVAEVSWRVSGKVVRPEWVGPTGSNRRSASPVIDSLIRLTIGPSPAAGARTRSRSVFDAHLPLDANQLEELGAEMAFYTLGDMADQPEVDLSGWEWSRNVEAALEAVPSSHLTSRALRRREALLRQFR